MAFGKQALTVITAQSAAHEIKLIHNYNAEHRGARQAERYEQFLRKKIAGLAISYSLGSAVSDDPSMRYVLMKPRTGGDGHIAIYSVDFEAKVVEVLHVFHTKQDWQSKI